MPTVFTFCISRMSIICSWLFNLFCGYRQTIILLILHSKNQELYLHKLIMIWKLWIHQDIQVIQWILKTEFSSQFAWAIIFCTSITKKFSTWFKILNKRYLSKWDTAIVVMFLGHQLAVVIVIHVKLVLWVLIIIVFG